MRAIVLLFALAITIATVSAVIPARGWNDNIEWYDFDEGLAKAKETGKDILVVLHKTWCGACKRLKPDFESNKDIEQLSKHFIMINAEDDEKPNADPRYNIDGGYIPRIFFADSNGEPKPNVFNDKGSAQYKYFYGSASLIANKMAEYVRNQ